MSRARVRAQIGCPKAGAPSPEPKSGPSPAVCTIRVQVAPPERPATGGFRPKPTTFQWRSYEGHHNDRALRHPILSYKSNDPYEGAIDAALIERNIGRGRPV